MTKQQAKTVYVVTDDKGETHKVTNNIMGQKVRRATSGGRLLVWIIAVGGGSTFIRQHTHGIVTVALIVLLIAIAYQLICKVVVTGEELKSLRSIKGDVKG